jgi:Ser/Thr protein kinase RdoA (MazF antagonist)
MVHLDFHPDNVLLRRGVDPAAGGAIVIDWTSATVTDYRFGLASALVVIGAFQDWDESQAVLEDYQRQSGEAVENLEVFEAAACFLRLVLMTNSLMGDGQRIGMRSGIERMLRAQMPAMRRLYERFLRLTGIVIPEVEKLAHQGRFCASMGTTPGSTLLSRNSALHAASR